jgi:hypothetical protein
MQHTGVYLANFAAAILIHLQSKLMALSSAKEVCEYLAQVCSVTINDVESTDD